jgi:phosphonate transport system substrate-binding protein
LIISPRFLFAFAGIFILLAGCTREEPTRVNLTNSKVMTPTSSVKGPEPIKIGMGAMITPKEGYAYYYQMKEYLAQKIGWPVELVDRDTYDQIAKALKSDELNVAFVCSGPYVEGHDSYGLKIVAVPVVNGTPTYHAYIIVHQKSQIRDFQQLRGASFAFTDPKSNTGKIVPTYMLAKMNETPESFFRKTIYTYGHDKAIKAVAEGFVEGASVDSLIWENIQRAHPELTAKTRIIAKSPPYGIPPLVATKKLDPHIFNALQNTLLSMHKDEAGKKILAGMNIDRFALQPDSAYDSVREMNRWIASQKVAK